MAEAHVSLHSLTPLGVKQLSRQQKLELLHRHRETHTRNANVVYLLASDVLAGGTSGIGSTELYSIYEQILVAALDCGRVNTARDYLKILQKRFGKSSVRVRHLEGFCLEAEGAVEAAQSLYRDILKASPTDGFPIRRLSAMLKSEGKYREAIEVLENKQVYIDDEEEKHTYLEVQRGSDTSVYRELSNLYYLCEDIPKARFYADEAMLFNSNSYLTHSRLAELYYTSGELRKSVVEYAQSLRLNDHSNNSRAAYGLWVATNEIVKQNKSSTKRAESEDTEEIVQLRTWAGNKLLQMYVGSPMLSSVETMLLREV